MENTKITVLNELLHTIENKNFDLESWKIKASLIMKKVFGRDDEKVSLIKNLQYDYSSWSLRDHSGGRQHDSVKDKAREIIETALLELKLTGDNSDILNSLRNKLTGAQFNTLQSIIDTTPPDAEKLKSFFTTISSEIKDDILIQLLTAE